jgi:preprotein translocase subunit Sec61beta
MEPLSGSVQAVGCGVAASYCSTGSDSMKIDPDRVIWIAVFLGACAAILWLVT